MAEHKHGEMDVTAQEKTFEGFMRWVTNGAIVCILVLSSSPSSIPEFWGDAASPSRVFAADALVAGCLRWAGGTRLVTR